MEQRRSEVDSGSDSQQIPHSLRKPKFHDFIHKSPSRPCSKSNKGDFITITCFFIFFCEFRSFNTLCILLNIHMGEVKADNYRWHHAPSIVIGSAWCCIVRRHRNSRTGFRNKCSTLSVVGTVPAPSALCCSPSTLINCGVRSFLLLHSTVWVSLTYNGWAVTFRT
jgi:hypothetical protein